MDQKAKKTKYQINHLNDLTIPEIEERQWSHHSLPNINDLTPALRHYVELKIDNPDRVLLYRLGDFFECFFEDAITLSQLLEITLTSKEGGKKIGKVTSAVYSPRLKKNIALAIVDINNSENGNNLKVIINNEEINSKVIEKPFYDPKKKIASS